jgi:hypothetical protein
MPQKHLSWFVLALTLISGANAFADEASSSNTEQHARDLVTQLASSSYTQRESAAQQLAALGEEARTALTEGLREPNAETRLRVERILALIEQNDFQRLVDAFLTSTDPDAGSELPGWQRFRDLVGDDRESREMYVGMLKAEGDLLVATARSPRAAAGAFQLRCQQLQVESAAQAREIDAATLAAVLFVASDDRVPMTPGVDSLLYRFCSHSSVEKVLEDKENNSLMRRVVASWIASGRGGYYSLRLAMRHELPEGLAAAEKMLDGDTPAYYRQYAILTYAKLGAKTDIPRLMKLLDDATICTTHRVNNETFQTQFRDIALVAVLHLAGYDPQMFGFERIREHSEYVYSPYTLGFKTEDERTAAFSKWEKVKAKVAVNPTEKE